MAKKNEEKLKFSAEISKVLQLMIHSLYTNKDIFLRELISNASDACDKLRYAAITTPELAKDAAEYEIHISIGKDARTLTISDNGIGMSRDDLVNNLGTIAKSGTQEFLGQLSGDGKKDLPLIGQFGVGFYSAFMVANKVDVVSRKAGSDEAWAWESEGLGEFTVREGAREGRGTSITLHLKEGEDEYLDKFRLRHIVQTYSDHISFPIRITDEEGVTETVNTASALWMRSKSDVTPEQYKEFYHHVAHLPDEPWLTLHNKAEGKLEYTNLLFVPSMKPFDLFHPDRKRRVKLYVKRVFITEENVDLVPHYLRFLRGVVDSEDLPLNISRETLQSNPLLGKIKDAVAKRVLAELKKKSDADAEGYQKFWANFGPVLKEGLCEATTPREQILDACLFHSTYGDVPVSLDSYISRMKEGQKDIFYLTGENIEAMRASPQLEGFAARGVEVLLMCDHVDDFWVNVVFEHKGKTFKSVTRADIDLDAVAKPEEKAEDKAEKPDEDKLAQLCQRLKTILGDTVSEVRPTNKLSSSAVCLAVREGAMDFRLERFLIEQKQLATAAAKILEVNPEHAIIRSLIGKLEGGTDMEDVAWMLLDQARILEGEPVSDPAAFTRRLQSFVEKSLAA
ncbi:MAG: molecular chaperone HtpG [Proteobacteria bacterium]|nr:molecular chaperone HtpG [Pseudomonadota bacterium]